MEGAKRWETEAIRESRDRRRGRPTVSQSRTPARRTGEWVTLREAADGTGIPIGTLRKWCRRETVDSYLESDGEVTLRIVEMGSVRRRAAALGRETDDTRHKTEDARHETQDTRHKTQDTRHKTSVNRDPGSDQGPDTEYRASETAGEAGTMIVPVDAWNKMLNQLGNLHEAGQQLAEARERAAKAETEAAFLRERLAELRETTSPPPRGGDADEPSGSDADQARSEGAALPVAPSDARSARATSPVGQEPAAQAAATVSFWRYVVRGWKGRRR